jgi:hypothetical protein
MEADTAVYENALRRIYRGMKWLACAGALAGLCFKGWLWALAFLMGAMASYLNFSWLDQIVAAIGPHARPPRKRLFVFIGLRYVLLGGAGYVIVKVFGMSAIAAVSGLFIPIAAVFLETIYELVHAGT